MSVVIPTLEEAGTVAAAVESAREADEVIVIDGGSRDGTVTRARDAGATVVSARRGRALQMNEGARLARSELLVFLHADSRLPAGFAADLLRLTRDGTHGWGRFDLEFDDRSRLLGLVAAMISLRSRLTRTGTGDQAIFVSRDLFARAGGYPEQVLFEDIELARRLRRLAPMAVPARPVLNSARRWRVAGAWRTIVRMWLLRLLYLAGCPAGRLARFYPDIREQRT